MNQQLLLISSLFDWRVVDMEWIRAKFIKVFDDIYDVILEISSQKFLIKLEKDWDEIRNFEIIAVRWFVSDLTSSLVSLLRSLVGYLRLESN